MGKITISGEARAGAHVNFGKTEVYWPQDDESSKKYQNLLGMESSPSDPEHGSVTPVFELNVELDASLDVIVQPEVSLEGKPRGVKLRESKFLIVPEP